MIQYDNTVTGDPSGMLSFKTVYFLNTFSNLPAVFLAPYKYRDAATSTYLHGSSLSSLISGIYTSYFTIGTEEAIRVVLEVDAAASWLAIGA